MLPKTQKQREKETKKRTFLTVVLKSVLILALVFSFIKFHIDEAIVAQVSVPSPVQNPERLVSLDLNEILTMNNNSLVRVYLNGKKYDSYRLKDIGISYSVSKLSTNLFRDNLLSSLWQYFYAYFFTRIDSIEYSSNAVYIVVNQEKWDAFVEHIKSKVEKPVLTAKILWNTDQGWYFQQPSRGMELNQRSVDLSLDNLISDLKKFNNNYILRFSSSVVRHEVSASEEERLKQLYEGIEAMVSEPISLKIGQNQELLDLNSSEKFLSVEDFEAHVNTDEIVNWIDKLVEKYYLPANEVRIVGREEVRPNVYKAVFEGEFVEGSRLNRNEILETVLSGLENNEKELTVRLYELPVKVYSELENTPYELLSVGYSEYSHGNAPNRVHNIKTGLGKINGTLIDVDQGISFNRVVGGVGNDYRMGWAIFGTVAKPVLGGGLCQVSTTFYRSLLNLGIPITMRKNHSWDLSYYREGGYGLDATVYPSAGLDVKAENDLGSQLLFYSYTRPETEQAFVLVYGRNDGRSVILEPMEEYIPWRGAKTLKWTQTIVLPDGTIKENLIVSRYRS